MYFCRPGLFGVDHRTSEVVGNSHFELPLRSLGVLDSLPLPAGCRPRLLGPGTRKRARRIHKYIPAVEEGAAQLYLLVLSKPTEHRQVVYSSTLFRAVPVPVNNEETVLVKVVTNVQRTRETGHKNHRKTYMTWSLVSQTYLSIHLSMMPSCREVSIEFPLRQLTGTEGSDVVESSTLSGPRKSQSSLRKLAPVRHGTWTRTFTRHRASTSSSILPIPQLQAM